MTKEEELELKKKYLEELNKQERINQLVNDEKVKEFIELLSIDKKYLLVDRDKLLQKVLDNFRINETNNIYVCFGTYYTEINPFYTKNSIQNENPYTKYKRYRNIENLVDKVAYTDSYFPRYGQKVLIDDFEKENIVLNPHNTTYNLNGFYEVRMDYFNETINTDQNNAKKLILEKYPRL